MDLQRLVHEKFAAIPLTNLAVSVSFTPRSFMQDSTQSIKESVMRALRENVTYSTDR